MGTVSDAGVGVAGELAPLVAGLDGFGCGDGVASDDGATVVAGAGEVAGGELARGGADGCKPALGEVDGCEPALGEVDGCKLASGLDVPRTASGSALPPCPPQPPTMAANSAKTRPNMALVTRLI
jgi:hypothetical protein